LARFLLIILSVVRAIKAVAKGEMANLMKNAYIKFLTDEDRRSGFRALSSANQIISLSDEVFCIPMGWLRLLDEASVGYTQASNDEVTRTGLRTWRFPHVGRPIRHCFAMPLPEATSLKPIRLASRSTFPPVGKERPDQLTSRHVSMVNGPFLLDISISQHSLVHNESGLFLEDS